MTRTSWLRRAVARTIGTVAPRASRTLRAGDGTVIGGRVALLADPTLPSAWARDRRITVVTGTNGKTTTTALLAAALGGRSRPATNAGGANLATGIAAAMIAGWHAQEAVFEVDEAVLPWALTTLRPALAVLLNLSRDQLDRLHEVQATAAAWRQALATTPGVQVVANADDPLVVWAARGARTAWAAVGQPWHLDAAACPSCSGAIRFFGDDWSCSRCPLRRPCVDAALEGPLLVTASAAHPLPVGLPGRFNRANAAMALAAALALGVDAEQATAEWPAIHHIGPRFTAVARPASSLRLLMAKNPAGWLEIIDLLAERHVPVVIALNARVVDGMDTSWIWDVPFERLAGRTVVCTGERASDLSVRLVYAGVAHDFRPDLAAALAACTGEVDVVGNYSAFRAVARRLPHAS